MSSCSCGCGERTAGGVFKPGHDQKLRTELEQRAGGLLSLAKLVDTAEQFAEGRTSLDSLAQAARQTFKTASTKDQHRR
jgi:hypothetical protein